MHNRYHMVPHALLHKVACTRDFALWSVVLALEPITCIKLLNETELLLVYKGSLKFALLRLSW